MDKNTFGEMVMGAGDSLYRVAKSILHDDEDCADAIGEAIATGFEKLHTLKNDEFAKTWLIRILINECYSLRRYAQRFVSNEADKDESWADVVQFNGDDRDYTELYDAINKLSSKNRLIIVLYYIEGYSVKEIANLLKFSEGAVQKRMSRARSQMKEYLEKEEYVWIN